MSLPTRKVGTSNVTAIGFGAMGLSAFYGPPKPDEERFKVLDAAYEKGCTFWDTSDNYGDNEELIGKWFERTGKRGEIFIATKFGFVRKPDPTKGPTIDGSTEYVKEALDGCLSRLGVDQIDLWYLHRPDANTPIEVTVAAMAEAVKAGKVKYIGISECSEDTLRRAHAVHPISAVQFEYAPFTLTIEDPEVGIFQACRELGITLVAYSPLGRGLLTGKVTGTEAFDDNDIRKKLPFPRFSQDNLPAIMKLVDGLKDIAERRDATPAQVTLAWLLAQGDNVIPIPGTTKVERLDENLGALNVKLSLEELKEIRDLTERAGATRIPRHIAAFLTTLHYVDTPPLQEWKAGAKQGEAF